MAVLPKVPEYITVHLGAPSEDAPNVTIPFTTYIKNVASHEIYPTWPETAIRANILAQISYTLNRIYTEHYPSQGYDFDVTNDIRYDQAFVADGDIFQNIGRIVDEIFNDYIVREGYIEPLFAAFCDGVKTKCDGLWQWGTVELAEQGLLPYEILQYYYGDNIGLVFDAPVGNTVPSYPGRPLRRGDAGEDVRTIQKQLNRITLNFPAIPRIYPVTGVFDRDTENSVRAFQGAFNLAVDGIVGKATWYKIKRVWVAVKQLSDITSEGLTLSEAQRIFPTTLRLGDSGVGVVAAQYYLAFLGFFLPDLPPIGITGTFDETTRDAVYAFQSYAGLPIDGIIGRDTWNALQDTYARVLSNLPDPYQRFAAQIYPGRFLVVGDRGESVRQLQTALRTIAQSDTSLPLVDVDGIYGPQTQQAVLALQRQYGYDETGSVGPRLWAQIINGGVIN